MRTLLVLLAFVLLPVRVEAAWSAVGGQTAQTTGNDQTMTFTSAIGASNHVIILVIAAAETNTYSITGNTLSWTTIGPLDSPAESFRAYIFCAQGDGADSTFVIDASAGGTAQAFGIEFSGGTCTQDGSTSSNDDAGDAAYELATDITTTGSASLLVSVIRSTTSADFVAGTNMTLIATAGTAAAAEYRILSASGTFDTPWTSAATETAFLGSAAFQAAAATSPCLRGLMGYGCNE